MLALTFVSAESGDLNSYLIFTLIGFFQSTALRFFLRV